jgi:flagellar biosynthesis/type III secretory pathway chaperone
VKDKNPLLLSLSKKKDRTCEEKNVRVKQDYRIGLKLNGWYTSIRNKSQPRHVG